MPQDANVISRIARWVIKAPVHAYRFTVRPWLGWPCRHLPTCSDYALQAVDKNGAWRGCWLILSRLLRCQPFGTAGFDPVPDIRAERHWFAPWLYGRWTGRHIVVDWTGSTDSKSGCGACEGQRSKAAAGVAAADVDASGPMAQQKKD